MWKRKRCPFCGGEVTVHAGALTCPTYICNSDSCGAVVSFPELYWRGLDFLDKPWNRRVVDVDELLDVVDDLDKSWGDGEVCAEDVDRYEHEIAGRIWKAVGAWSM